MRTNNIQINTSHPSLYSMHRPPWSAGAMSSVLGTCASGRRTHFAKLLVIADQRRAKPCAAWSGVVFPIPVAGREGAPFDHSQAYYHRRING